MKTIYREEVNSGYYIRLRLGPNYPISEKWFRKVWLSG